MNKMNVCQLEICAYFRDLVRKLSAGAAENQGNQSRRLPIKTLNDGFTESTAGTDLRISKIITGRYWRWLTSVRGATG